MKKFFRNKTFLAWFLGFLVITGVLFFAVFQFPGYIYYWDLSGAFSFRNPFEQYFSTNNPYDGVEVGVKHRLPVVMLIAALTNFFALFGFPAGEIAIKVAVWLMFVGAYTAFFYVIPRFDGLFSKKQAMLDRTGSMGPFLAMFLALGYLMIPFFTYRISQLHLFYFTTFYPLLVYAWMKLLAAERTSWRKYAIWLVALLYFGVTTPHSVVYYLLTFIALLFAGWMKIGWSRKWIFIYTWRLLLVLGVVASTHLYWLLPYWIEGTPAPGYVLSTDMITFLSQNSSFWNFLTDMSEWYLGQNPALGVLVPGFSLITLQYVGIASLYGFGLYFVISRWKSSPAVRWLSVLLIALLFVAVKEMPGFEYLYEKISFSSFGWLLREPNRIRFLWAFWWYVFFVLGVYRFAKVSKLRQKSRYISWSTAMTLLVTVSAYLVYVIPVFGYHLNFIKPTTIDPTFQEVQQKLQEEKASAWGGVYVYPRRGGYGISWKQQTFSIANETEYLFLPYNLPVPPVQRASVLASGQGAADLLGEEFVSRRVPLTSNQLEQLGIQYFLINKNPVPLHTSFPDLGEDIDSVVSYLSVQEHISLLVENNEYALFRVDIPQAKQIQAGGLVLSSLPLLELYRSAELYSGQQLVPVSELQNKVVLYTQDFTVLTRQKEVPFEYLDFLPEEEREKLSILSLDNAKRHASPVAWGRMSLKNLVNGEARNINFINGIKNYQRDLRDVILYSDSPAHSETQETYNISTKPYCTEGNCRIFAKVLFNEYGGNLKLRLSGIEKLINTKSSINEYTWVEIGKINERISGRQLISITNEKGYQAIIDLLVIPAGYLAEREAEWNQFEKYEITEEVNQFSQPFTSCTYVESRKVSTFSYEVNIDCPTPSVIRVANYPTLTHALYTDGRTNQFGIVDLSYPLSRDLYGTLFLVAPSTLLLLGTFALSFALMSGVIVVLAYNKTR